MGALSVWNFICPGMIVKLPDEACFFKDAMGLILLDDVFGIIKSCDTESVKADTSELLEWNDSPKWPEREVELMELLSVLINSASELNNEVRCLLIDSPKVIDENKR